MGRDLPSRIKYVHTIYFNPRAPHGARLVGRHADLDSLIFQSTRPAWGATCTYDELIAGAPAISIHAPRMGRDVSPAARSLAGDRFQSTRPAWGATSRDRGRGARRRISIHAPRMGRDGICDMIRCAAIYFNPRAPHGARPGVRWAESTARKFQSTRPAWGATR